MFLYKRKRILFPFWYNNKMIKQSNANSGVLPPDIPRNILLKVGILIVTVEYEPKKYIIVFVIFQMERYIRGIDGYQYNTD